MGDILPEYLPFIKDNLYAPKQSFEYRTWKIQQRRRERVYTPLPKQENMVVYWDDIVDNSGELMIDQRPGVGDWTQGKGVSAKFDGVSYGTLVDKVTGDPTSVMLPGTDWDKPISVKFQSTDTTPYLALVGKRGVTTDSVYMLLNYNEPGPIVAICKIGAVGQPILVASGTFNDGVEHVATLNYVGGVATLSIDGVEFASASWALNGGQAVSAFGVSGGGVNFIGNIWDATAPSFSNPLAQGGPEALCVSQVGPNVLWTGYTGSMYEESVLYGHEWGPHSEYVLADGITIGGEPVVGKIPPSTTGSDFDVVGNPLTNPGDGRNDFSVTGYQPTFTGVEYLTNVGLVGTETVVSSTGTSTPTISAGRIDFTAGTCSRILLSNGDDLVLESEPLSLQGSVWDIVNGNEYVLNSATLPFFDTEKDGSYLFAKGYRISGANYIPARADGLAADGNALTQTPAKLSGTHCKIYANESLSMYNLSVLAGVDADLYLAGAAIGLTPDEWVALVVDGNLNNALMLSTFKNTIAAWNPALIEPDITKAEKYLGII